MPAFTVGGPVLRKPVPRLVPVVDLPAAVPAPAILPASSQPKQEQPPEQPPAEPPARDVSSADAAAPAAAKEGEEQREGGALPAAETQPVGTLLSPVEAEAHPPPDAAGVPEAEVQDARQTGDAQTAPAVEVTPVAVATGAVEAAPAGCPPGTSAEADGGEPLGHAGSAAATALAPAASSGKGQPLQPATAAPATGVGVTSSPVVPQQSARDVPSAAGLGASMPAGIALAPAAGVYVAPQHVAAPGPDAPSGIAAATAAAALDNGLIQSSRLDSGVGGFSLLALVLPTASATADGAPVPMPSASALSAGQPVMSPLPAPSGWLGGSNGNDMAVAAQRAAFEAALGMAPQPDFTRLVQAPPMGAVAPISGAVMRPPVVMPMPPRPPQAPLPLQMPAQRSAAAVVGPVPSDPVAMFLNDGPDR